MYLAEKLLVGGEVVESGFEAREPCELGASITGDACHVGIPVRLSGRAVESR